MAKTFLQLLNEVGKNLRRSTGSTYTTITQSADVVLTGQLINEAKRMVEARWKWSALRATVNFTSVGGTATYALTDAMIASTVTRERAELIMDPDNRPMFWDVTTSPGFRMSLCTQDYAVDAQNVYVQTLATPGVAAVYDNGAGLSVKFPQAPGGVRNYRLVVKNPQDDLDNASTTLLVPWRPVVLAATAIAFDERGEDLGGDSNRWWERYEDALSEAMGRDSTAADFVLRADTIDGYWKN